MDIWSQAASLECSSFLVPRTSKLYKQNYQTENTGHISGKPISVNRLPHAGGEVQQPVGKDKKLQHSLINEKMQASRADVNSSVVLFFPFQLPAFQTKTSLNQKLSGLHVSVKKDIPPTCLSWFDQPEQTHVAQLGWFNINHGFIELSSILAQIELGIRAVYECPEILLAIHVAEITSPE
ncbi:hypothetical protein IEQ34_007999 [Dendrobium chrysotoxum]|uniref:Uncharacterized protein n=1 Tax=Dendrobium chrysotoxum TaxID=161865 RepID=A0AAV7H501_DENCH|nr:hypothetical protein IEQ34_007999 [Dendrobium chrysotoxum]